MPSISGRTDREFPARLVGYDLIIESAFPLPGALPIESADEGTADIHIHRLPAEPAPRMPEPIYRLEHDTLIFSPPGVATYRCRPDAITVALRDGADPDAVIALLIATALPAVLWMRNGFVLHAAAVRLPGEERALAVAGPSGSGKSTMVAQLAAWGADLIADDTLRIADASGVPMASGLAGGYHLAARQGEGRIFHAIPPSRSIRRSPLGAIVVLSQADGEPGLTPLDTVSAIEQMLANQHRARIPGLLERRADVLRFCAFLARAVPVYTWRRPRGAVALDAREWDTLTRCLRN